jgi:hypothetical protein
MDTKPQKLIAIFEDQHELDMVDQVLIDRAQKDDSPEAFIAFYMYITRGRMPEHAKMWIRQMYDDKEQDRASLIFAFRGSWKTTTVSQLFTAFRIGKEPWKANLILQNNDPTAQNTTLAISEVIDINPRYRDVFPNVVPNKKKGWGAQGYWIIDTEMDPAEWAERTSVTKDPTLLGLGISSGSVIGKHPTGVLLLDDIHDEKNTVSDLERAMIVKVVTDTVFPMAVRNATKVEGEQLETWMLAVGTPWHEQDAYHYMKETGEFGFLYSPLLFPVNEGDPGAIYFDHKKLVGWYRIAWEEHIPEKSVISLYNLSGHRGFWRMYLLSLIGASDLGLPFLSFPQKAIDDLLAEHNLIACGGVDYASMIEIRGKVVDPRNRSKFALAYGYILPTRVFVVTGGIIGHYTQLRAEGHVEKVQGMFPHYRTTGVEMNGKGEEFFAVLSRKPELDLLPYWTGKKAKDQRLESELGPWLEMGKIMVSDADTPFLNDLRKALWEFPHGNLDILDAVFGIAKTIPDVLIVDKKKDDENLPSARRHRKMKNPFTSFGARRYASNN